MAKGGAIASGHVIAPASQEVLCVCARAHARTQRLMILFETKWSLVAQRSNDNKLLNGSFPSRLIRFTRVLSLRDYRHGSGVTRRTFQNRRAGLRAPECGQGAQRPAAVKEFRRLRV